MAKRLMAIPMALAVVLGAQSAVFAQADVGQTRADAAIDMSLDQRIADLPAGHWATNATQVAVANNILSLENGQFMGQEQLTNRELRQAMDSLVNVAENIAGKGALTDLRAAVGVIPSNDSSINRLQLAQTLTRFLDAAHNQELVALGAPRSDADRFKDLGKAVPNAVDKVVDQYKVMTGFPDNTFRPQGSVTRYQMAAIALHILNDMREAPIAQQPVVEQPPVVVQPQAPEVIVVTPPEEEEEIAAVPIDLTRPDFRDRIPVTLSWQALNANNLNAMQAGTAGAFNVIPVSGMFTSHQGPVMLQNVTNFRYDLYQSNMLDSEFRIGYNDLKWGIGQLIPYVGANVGLGAAPGQIAQTGLQYDSYVGASYGAILSLLPMDNLELWGNFGQSALLGAGRFNSNFQAVGYPNALGATLSNYGVGLDFYVSPNIALTLGANTWQLPAQLRTANSLTAGGVDNVYGGNIGVGFGF